MVARLVLSHRLGVITEIVEGLAEAKMHVDPRDRIGAQTFRDLAHAIHQGAVGLTHALDRSQSLEDAGQSLDSQSQMRRRVLEHPAI